MIYIDSTDRTWYDDPVGTRRPLLAPALQELGIDEAASAVFRFLCRFPSSSANGCQTGIPPKRPLRVRPSNVVGIQTTGRSMYRGYCWAPTAAADANSIEAGSRAQRQRRTKIEHGAGSLIKVGPQDTKGVCADDGETLRVRILSALQRHGYHLTAAPDDCDGWLRRARSHDSEHHPDKSACLGSGAVL